MFIWLMILILFSCIDAQNVDLIVFSYNRPLQLWAFLESVEEFVDDIDRIYVICRASSKDYYAAYDILIKRFESVQFLMQDERKKRSDFKPLVLKSLTDSSSQYCMFAVDDIVIKDYFSCADAIKIMEEKNAYAFFFRLGLHVDQSYPVVQQTLPIFIEQNEHYLIWDISSAACNWACMHNVDLTLYRKHDVLKCLNQISFSCPSTLESSWGDSRYTPVSPRGICYYTSKMVNIPLNQVQEVWYVPNMNYLNAEQLLAKFNEGLKLDRRPFFKLNNRSPHIDHIPTFIQRD